MHTPETPEFMRQQDLLLPGQLEGADIDLVGGGGIGSAILLVLCKMGCGIMNRITVTDFDRCRTHNLPTQWFRPQHASREVLKVDALAETVEFLCERRIATSRIRFTGSEGRRLGPIVILAVDSLEERARIWERLKARSDVEFLIDARMGAEIVEIHALALGRDPHAPYEQSLENPAEGLVEPCTRQAIVYTSLGAAAFVAKVLRSYVLGLSYPRFLLFDFENLFLERRP